jgi:hypothetical protein
MREASKGSKHIAPGWPMVFCGRIAAEEFCRQRRPEFATLRHHMTAALQVIDPDMVPLCVEKVFIDASGELRAKVSGVECSIGTNETLVGAGLVMFHPVDARLARLHPIFTHLNVSGFVGHFWCVATDPRLVNAAARFNVLKRHGNAVAQQELWPGEEFS